MSKKLLVLLTVLVMLAGMVAGCGATPEPTKAPEPTAAPAEPTAIPEPTEEKAAEPQAGVLRLATTTSTADSGLLDYILPDFEAANGVKVDVVAVGTGQAIEIGTKGDADVLLVHSRASEDQFVTDGYAKERFDVMYNDYILVGPVDDPAKIKGMATAQEAFKAIADAGATFVSRGDDSGTHKKELSIWKKLELDPTQGQAWYNSIGQGMGDTLLFANEKQGYTVSDRATWLSMQEKLPGLTILVGGANLAENKDKALYNPYGVLAVNPEKHPGVNAELATKFVEWITSVKTQELIASYAYNGEPLFYPNSEQYKAAQPAPAPEEPAAPALKLTGTAAEIGWTEDELKALGTLDVDYTGKDGTTTTYTGVLITKLLEQAGIQGDAYTLVLVAGDGYTAEVAAADVQNCADCIVAFDPEGGLRSVLPAGSGKQQVKGLVEIQVTGGGAAPQASGGIPENAALKITGKVGTEIGWLEEEVRAMETMEAQSTNKAGETKTYTGVLIAKLLEMAGPAADATTIVFVADDGYTAEAPLADVLACADCIISFREQGGFSSVLPGFAGALQVKGVIEMQLK